MKNKNSETLKSFIDYCEANPEQRFWQALRNWSGWSFIYAGTAYTDRPTEDTYYWEGRGPLIR